MVRPLTEAEFITLFVGGGSHTNTAPQPLPTAKYTFLPHPAYCFSDASHLVACNPGDAIRFFYDPSALAWFEQPTSGSRLILRQTGSKYYAESTGSAFHPWANMSALTYAVTIGAACQLYSNVFYQMLFSAGNRELRQSGVQAKIEIADNNGGGSIAEAGTLSYNQDYQYIATCGIGGANTTLYSGGTSVGVAADSTTGNMPAASAIGGRPEGTYTINGRIYGMAVFQTNPGVSTFQNWLRGLQP